MTKNIVHSELDKQYRDLKQKITSLLQSLKNLKNEKWSELSKYDKKSFYNIRESDIRTKKEILKIMRRQARELKMLIWYANSIYSSNKTHENHEENSQ